MSFKFLPHKADFKMRIYADNLEKVFIESLNAINAFLKPKLKEKSKKIKISVKIKSLDIESLLIDFLSEILAKIYIKKAIFKILKIKIKKNILEAVLLGTKFELLYEDIKAITYHQARIKKINNRYFCEFIIDV